jgi:CRP-like cAMP-binding protein
MPFNDIAGRVRAIPVEAEFRSNWSAEDFPGTMAALALTRRYHRGQEIYGRDEPVEYWYGVMSGMARKTALMSDGRRRIVDFLVPGDFFGFSALDERIFDVEAVTGGTTLACYPRRRIEALADTDLEVSRHVRNLAMKALCRLQARILILGHPTATEKVRAFLVEMGQRAGDDSSPIVILSMSRYDIADYLALSVETVSRALTTLKLRGSISLADKHRVKLVDHGAKPDRQGFGLN